MSLWSLYSNEKDRGKTIKTITVSYNMYYEVHRLAAEMVTYNETYLIYSSPRRASPRIGSICQDLEDEKGLPLHTVEKLILVSLITHCGGLGNLFNLSVSLFPHL